MVSQPPSKIGRTVGLQSKKKKNTISSWLMIIFLLIPAVSCTILAIKIYSEKYFKRFEEPAPSFQEIRQTIENRTTTDAQSESYRLWLQDRLVDWEGWISEVKWSGYECEIYVDMDNPQEPLSTPDIFFKISPDIALQFRKDEYIRFAGQIQSVEEKMFGGIKVRIKNVALLSE